MPTRTARTNFGCHAARTPRPSRSRACWSPTTARSCAPPRWTAWAYWYSPSYIVYDDIIAGRLIPVLDDWELPRLQINIAYPSRKHLSAKVRSFIDFMINEFEHDDCERKWNSFMALREAT